MTKTSTSKQYIAEWLRLKQDALGLSIRGLAEAIGIPDSTMRTYLDPTDPHAPQPDILRRIATFLDIDELTVFMIAYNLADSQTQMSISEHHVLDLYRTLSARNKELAVTLLQTMADQT